MINISAHEISTYMKHTVHITIPAKLGSSSIRDDLRKKVTKELESYLEDLDRGLLLGIVLLSGGITDNDMELMIGYWLTIEPLNPNEINSVIRPIFETEFGDT